MEVDIDSQISRQEKETDDKVKEFNYLLTMAIWSLSYEQVEKLKREV